MPMRYRLFGNSGLRVSELFLGAMTFGEESGPGASPEECLRMFNAYAEAGGNVIDTASNYRGGASETILGDILKGRRQQFVVGTKYTISRDPLDPNASGNHRKNLIHSLETSLKRLQTDYIDIYWVHIWDHHTPIEETMRALDDAVQAGKILYVGISDTPAWVVSRANTLAEWRGWTSFIGLQVPYNLLKRDIERELLPMAESYKMSLAVWSPLANGILSGKYTSAAPAEGKTRLAPESLSERDHAVARVVEEVALELGVTPSQVALAWVRSRSQSIHPIIGARRLEQLIDNMKVLDVVLPAEVISRLEAAAPFEIGFPTDFIAQTGSWVFGKTASLVDERRS